MITFKKVPIEESDPAEMRGPLCLIQMHLSLLAAENQRCGCCKPS